MTSARWLAVALGLVLTACSQVVDIKQLALDGRADQAAVERVVVAMGTSLHVVTAAPSRAVALAASEAAVRAVERAEQRLSTWRADSQLAALCAAPARQPQRVSAALARELTRAREFAQATGGAFDPCVGALRDAYDLRGEGRWPDAAARAQALRDTGVRHLGIDGDSVTRLVAGVVVDAGAFGKGAALDDAAAAMLAAGARSGVLDFGGQTLLVGAGGEAHFAVAAPDDRARVALRLSVDRGSLATTGNSERARVVDGRALGHVLDPRTGLPARDFGSVTVWAPTAFAADCLSTALFVMGPAAAIAWAEQHDDVEALVLERTSGSLVARATSGLRRRITAVAPEVTIQ